MQEAIDEIEEAYEDWLAGDYKAASAEAKAAGENYQEAHANA